MKWLRSVSLGICVLLTVGCAQVEPTPATTAQPPRVYTWQRQTLADTPDCRMELESVTVLENGDCRLVLSCENRLDSPVLFSCQDIMLDGWLLREFWGEEFPGNARRRCQVTLPGQAMGYPQRLDLAVKIFTQADLRQAYLCSRHITLYAVEADPGRFQSPPSPWAENSRVLADNSGCAFSMAYTGADGAGQHFLCLMENKTRQSLAFRIHSLRCQGRELEPVWTVQLPPGARCGKELVIPTREARGELSLHIQKQDKWFSDVLVNECFYWEAAQ